MTVWSSLTILAAVCVKGAFAVEEKDDALNNDG